MPKRFFSFKYKALTVCMHILVLVLAVVIFAVGMGKSILLTHDLQQIVINPFEANQPYEESSALKTAFLDDANDLINYLAVCRQFETDGEFDTNKEIDILEYYFRKNPSLKDIHSNGVLKYRVQDLIIWKDSYGFTTYDEKELEEVVLPTDGVSIYAKQADILPLMEMCKIIISQINSGYEHPYAVDFEYSDEQTLYVENGISETASDKRAYEEAYEDKYDEAAATYDKAYIEEYDEMEIREAYELLTEILISVASDLSYNYSVYQEQKTYFTSNTSNFKYLYTTGENDFYTNLDNVTVGNVKEYAAKFEENARNMSAYVCIDATSGNIESRTVDVSAHPFHYNLNQMKYAFQDGGKIYLGVAADTIPNFAEYHEEDIYSQIKDGHEYFAAYFDYFIVGIFILLLLSLFILVIYTLQCGRKNDSEEIVYHAFDRWYTEVAAAIGIAVAVLLVAVAIFSLKILFDASTVFIYQLMHYYYLMYLLIFMVLICDLLFLFFYGSLVRRIKAGRLLGDSLICRLFSLQKKGLKLAVRGIRATYRNAGVFFKTVLWFVPCVILLFAHYIAGAYEQEDVLWLLALILDVVVFGLMLYVNLIRSRIIKGVERISGGDLEYQVETTYVYGDNLRLANAVNHIGDGIREAVNQSMKDERMKADLITNVSHDIKTPLTSIINYVDLIKRENVQDETIRGYIEILDSKSQRLKQLTEDLVEASKITSGNIVLNIEELNVVDLMKQALGEFVDKFEEKELELVLRYSETACLIEADSRRMWRVIDNLLGNIYKYAMEKTRVYIEVKDLSNEGKKVSISIKNISKQALNIEAEELTERFIRGDISRSTEGSGLGLSIAKSLVEAQGGSFHLYLDGDLFKVTIVF